MSLLAVDIGSSSCKAIAFSESGCTLARKSFSYPPPQCLRPSWAEMPAECFWQALTVVCRAISAEVKKDPVEALAISSHGETLVPVNSRQQALAPAILNYDNRAVAEAKWLTECLGARQLFDVTGLTVHPMYPVAKILWLRTHQADVYSSAARFLALPDYLLTRLDLPPLIDYSLASRFLAFDIRKHQWSAEILAACDLSPGQLPQPVPAGCVAGELSRGAAKALGLKGGTVVVVGGHDQPCGALGCGVVEPGRVSASLGTYECLSAASKSPVLNDAAFASSLNSYCHVVPNRYVTLAYFPSGIMLEWFLRLICPQDKPDGPVSGNDLYAQLETQAPEGPSGLCVTPHLLGTCNPDFNPEAAGVIAGIRPSTSRGDVYKGILEGIACEFASMTELLQTAVGPFDHIYVAGGGTCSALGLRLRAALSDCTLLVVKQQEAVCLGTAILAGVALKKFSCSEALEQLVLVSRRIPANADVAESYRGQQEQYRLMYGALAPIRRAQIAAH